MARTHEKVRYSPKSERTDLTPTSAAKGVEDALKILEAEGPSISVVVSDERMPNDSGVSDRARWDRDNATFNLP